MAQRFYEPIARIFTNAGAVGVGYKYYFYLTGTTTPVTTYQNAGLTVANTNPVLSDANGRFPEIWYSDLSQLKLIVKDSLDNTIETVDPVGATASAISLNDFDVRPTSYWGLTAGTSTAYTLIANPTISAYANTQTFIVQVHVDCGASPTLTIDGLSAFNWKKYTQQGTKTALKANDLKASQRYFCVNDGVDVVCLNPNSLPILSGSATALTIATGAVTLTNNSSSYVLDTEGATASDDLDTINGGQDGQIVYLNTANSSRDVTLKNGTGNIVNPYGFDIILTTTNNNAVLRYNGTSWIVLSNTSLPQPELLLFQAASSSAQIDFTNLASTYAGYSHYEFRFINVTPATNSVAFGMRTSTDNGSSYSNSGYINVVSGCDSASSPYSDNGTTTYIALTGPVVTISNTGTFGVNGLVRIGDLTSSSKYKFAKGNVTYWTASSRIATSDTGGIQGSNTTAINAIRFLFSSGNISSGTIELWGYK